MAPVLVERKELKARLDALEQQFPDAERFQQVADATQLFLAHQIRELAERVDRLEGKMPSRLEIIGTVLGTLVALVAVFSGLATIVDLALKAWGVIK